MRTLHALASPEKRGPNSEQAASLAVKLEQTIANWLPSSLYNKRIQLCGGRSQTGNGFRMWRRLHQDNVGSGEIIEFANTEALRDYGRCDRIEDTSSFIDAWLEAVDTHGGELEMAPKMLKSMFLNILPRSLKSEIMKEQALYGAHHLQIIEWVRARCLILQQEQLADIARKSLTRDRSRKMDLVKEGAEPSPDASEISVGDEDGADLQQAPRGSSILLLQ